MRFLRSGATLELAEELGHLCVGLFEIR